MQPARTLAGEIRGELASVAVVPLLAACHVLGLGILGTKGAVVGYAAVVAPLLSVPQAVLLGATAWACTTGFVTHGLGELAFARPDLVLLGVLAAVVALPHLSWLLTVGQTGMVPRVSGVGPVRRRRGYALALLGLVVLTVVLAQLRGHLELPSDMLFFLLLTLLVALVGGRGPAVVSAVASSLLLNYFFTPPLHTWAIDRSDNVVNLVVFLTVAGLVSWAVDLAERQAQQAAEAAARAEGLAAVARLRSALLTAVGHDLRSPLAVAKAGVSGARSVDLPLPPADRSELLASADRALDRLAALVDNLLDLSRLQTGATQVRLQPTMVEEVVVRALDDIGVAPREVVLEVDEDLPAVLADAGLLERVLANLVANAQRYSPPGLPPEVRGAVQGPGVEIRIVDHGPGVPDTEQERIFQPFQRLGDNDSSSGVGLGLALARGLTEAMGGLVRAEPTPAGGLTLVVTLEAAPVEAPR